MNDKLITKRDVPNHLRNSVKEVGGIEVLVRDVVDQNGLPFGDVCVTIPATEDRPAVVVYAQRTPLAHPTSAYHIVNRELQARGLPPENGDLKSAVKGALEPYVQFVEELEPKFREYNW